MTKGIDPRPEQPKLSLALVLIIVACSTAIIAVGMLAGL